MTVGLAEKVAYLQSLTAFDHVVDTIETHMSFVFLTGPRAFKLKKPIRLPYVDHATIERRRTSCQNELRLGLRLAPDVYESVVPLVATPRGLAIGGAGQIVDWLVVMRRLPADLMLPQMLARGAATDAHADRVGDLLAAFYRRATPSTWTAEDYRHQLRSSVIAIAGELVARGLDRDAIAHVTHAQLHMIDRDACVFATRLAAHRVVDAHGDLRPEHVCLETPPVIIDPLEFDDDLRTLDAASELAFFSLECDRIGGSWFGNRVFARYSEVTGDHPPPSLVTFFRSQHASTRALLALRHLDDVPPSDYPRWRAKVNDYTRRAAQLMDAPPASS